MYYYKLSEDEKELMEEIANITGVDYELLGDFIPFDSFMYALKDLKIEYEAQKEKYEDLQENLKDNYRPITPSEMGWDIN